MVVLRKAKRKRLTLAISMVLTSGVVYANFAPQLELSDLNGTNGFVINGRESMTIQAHPSARLVISMAMVSVI